MRIPHLISTACLTEYFRRNLWIFQLSLDIYMNSNVICSIHIHIVHESGIKLISEIRFLPIRKQNYLRNYLRCRIRNCNSIAVLLSHWEEVGIRLSTCCPASRGPPVDPASRGPPEEALQESISHVCNDASQTFVMTPVRAKTSTSHTFVMTPVHAKTSTDFRKCTIT